MRVMRISPVVASPLLMVNHTSITRVNKAKSIGMSIIMLLMVQLCKTTWAAPTSGGVLDRILVFIKMPTSHRMPTFLSLGRERVPVLVCSASRKVR